MARLRWNLRSFSSQMMSLGCTGLSHRFPHKPIHPCLDPKQSQSILLYQLYHVISCNIPITFIINLVNIYHQFQLVKRCRMLYNDIYCYIMLYIYIYIYIFIYIYTHTYIYIYVCYLPLCTPVISMISQL